jgi:hypothetical protein
MNDPTQLAALAALVGITPETHPHLKNGYCTCGKPDCPEPLTFNLPALDTPAGDDVFLAPVMRWLKVKGLHFSTHDEGYLHPPTVWVQSREVEIKGTMTITAALIRACQSAGVPEIVAIFGEAINE